MKSHMSNGDLKMEMPRWAFGAMFRPLLEMPTSHRRVPEFKSRLSFHSSFLQMCTLGGSRWLLKYLGPGHTCGMEFLSPGVSLVQPQLLQALGKWTRGLKIHQSLSLPLSNKFFNGNTIQLANQLEDKQYSISHLAKIK